jgi:hypothetical protein
MYGDFSIGINDLLVDFIIKLGKGMVYFLDHALFKKFDSNKLVKIVQVERMGQELGGHIAGSLNN